MSEGPFNGSTQKVVYAIFLMLLAGFGGLLIRTVSQQDINMVRIAELEAQVKGLDDAMRLRTDDRYRLSDSLRDFAFDRSEIASLKLRVERLERPR